MTENELLDELIRIIRLEPLRDEDITAERLAEASGITTKQALNILNKMEREGKITKRWARMRDGHRVLVFQKKGEQ